ncbi:MAG: cell division protein FtsL [Pseudohongiellaceae bacterium]
MSAQTTRTARVQHSAGTRRGQQSVLVWADLFSARMTFVLVLLTLLLISGVSVIYTTFKNRYLLNELQQLKNERNELQVQWGQLLIEQSTFSLEGRIERKAIDELQMVVPDFSEIVMVRYE